MRERARARARARERSFFLASLILSLKKHAPPPTLSHAPPALPGRAARARAPPPGPAVPAAAQRRPGSVGKRRRCVRVAPWRRRPLRVRAPSSQGQPRHAHVWGHASRPCRGVRAMRGGLGERGGGGGACPADSLSRQRAHHPITTPLPSPPAFPSNTDPPNYDASPILPPIAAAALARPPAPPSLPASLPVLPFDRSDPLVPGQSKTLRLYEARFLALLDEVLARPDRCLAHTAVSPLGGPVSVSPPRGSSSSSPLSTPPPLIVSGPGGALDGGFVLSHAVLAVVTGVEADSVGARVRVRGEARLAPRAVALGDAPYMRLDADVALDDAAEDGAVLAALGQVSEGGVGGWGKAGGLVCFMHHDRPLTHPTTHTHPQELEALMWDVVNLCFKLPRSAHDLEGGGSSPAARGPAALQSALAWADGPPSARLTARPPGCSPALAAAAERGARLAFASLQEVPHAFAGDRARAELTRARLAALATGDTAARLRASAALLRQARATLAAKAALKGLALG